MHRVLVSDPVSTPTESRLLPGIDVPRRHVGDQVIRRRVGAGVDVDGRPQGVIADRSASAHRSGGESESLSGPRGVEGSAGSQVVGRSLEGRQGPVVHRDAEATRERDRPPNQSGPGLPDGPSKHGADRSPDRLGIGEPSAATGQGGEPSGDPASVGLGVGRLDPAAVVGYCRDGDGDQHGDRGQDGQQTVFHDPPTKVGCHRHPNGRLA